MKPTPMERHFLDLVDRMETDQDHQSARLHTMDQRLTRIETTLAQHLRPPVPPPPNNLSPEQVAMLVEGITILSKQLERSENKQQALQQDLSDLRDLLTTRPGPTDGG